MLTSNKADITTDLANRCACVRILKQPEGHAFAHYPEGDILEHVRKEQPRFLGAVFAIVKAWYAAGKPKTNETRHDFRAWAQALDWIAQNLLDAGPLLDGHRETQARMTNPVLNWLRDLSLEVIRAKQADAWLRTGDIVELIADTDIDTPGLPEHGDLTDHETRKKAQQATGRKLSSCFRAGDTVSMDGMTVERREQYDAESRYHVKEYRVTTAAIDCPPITATPPEAPAIQSEGTACGYGCGYGAAIESAMKPPAAANATEPPLKCEYKGNEEREEQYIVSMGTHSRIVATREKDLAAVGYEEGEL